MLMLPRCLYGNYCRNLLNVPTILSAGMSENRLVLREILSMHKVQIFSCSFIREALLLIILSAPWEKPGVAGSFDM